MEFLGCYKDSRADRDLPVFKGTDFGAEKCSKACDGYRYFGLQYTNECWCGASDTRKYERQVCPQGTSIGGSFKGLNNNYVWDTHRDPKDLIGPWKFMGCFKDEGVVGVRDLDKLGGNNIRSPKKCMEACTGYKYFGMQWHGECFCGNNERKYASQACPSDSSQYGPFYGGGNNYIYKVDQA